MLFCLREAVGVEPGIGVENAQLIDSVNARIDVISRAAKTAMRPFYSHFPESPHLPDFASSGALLAKRAF